MKTLFPLLIPFLAIRVLAASDGDTLWTKRYGTPFADGCYASCNANGPGIILAGYTYSSQGEQSNAVLMKITEDGEYEWTAACDEGGWEAAYGITQMHDETGYIYTGYILKPDSTQMDLLIVGTNNNGVPQWVKKYGGTGLDQGYSICRTPDGNYLVLGATTSFGAGEDDFYLLKIDGDGDTLWTRTYGCPRSDVGYSCLVTASGEYLLAGSTGIFDTPGVTSGNNRDIYVVKTDENGYLLDSANFYIMGSTQGEFDAGYDVCELADGNFCIVGACSKESAEAMNVAVLKIDPELDLVWKKSYEPGTFYDFGYAVCEMTADSGVLIAGSLNHAIDGTTDGFIMKLNVPGDEIWHTVLPFPGYESLRTISGEENETYTVSGFINTLDGTGYDFWVVKVMDTQVSAKPSEGSGNRLFQNRPNPCLDHTTIDFSLERPSRINLDLYTTQGKLLLTHSVTCTSGGKFNLQLSLAGVPAGTYIYSLTSDVFNASRKLVIRSQP